MSVILLPGVGRQSLETVASLQRLISVSKIAQKPLGYVTEPFFLDRKASNGRKSNDFRSNFVRKRWKMMHLDRMY